MGKSLFQFFLLMDISYKNAIRIILTLPKGQYLESSKLKEIADDNFRLDENDVKFSERVENTVGKGVIAHHMQYLHFLQSFQKTSTADT